MFHEVLIFHHLLGREGQGQRDGKGQTLGNGDGQHGDAQDDVIDDGRGRLSVDAQTDDAAHDEGDGGGDGAGDADLLGDEGELGEEGGFVVPVAEVGVAVVILGLVHAGPDLAGDGADADGDDDHLAGALRGGGARQDHVAGPLGHHLGLAGEGALVHLEGGAGLGAEEDAVGGDGREVVRVDAEDVADDDVGVDDVDLLPRADDGLGVGHLEGLGEADEGELLVVVDPGRDEDDDDDGQEDGGALDPARAARLPVLDADGGLDDDGNDAEHDEHDEDEVLDGLPA
mmetsp:Transcript_11127/g.31337  ORF Transcript_11127/g.31337 Transcript_11127/m.31337 type:complete len:286 (-) Transcript_11127:1134-1991(-)